MRLMQSGWTGCLLVALGTAGCREAQNRAAPLEGPGAVPNASAVSTQKLAADPPTARAAGAPPKAPPASVPVPAAGAAAAPQARQQTLGAAESGPPTDAAPEAVKAPAASEPLQRRIRYQLRELSPAPIALREARWFPAKDGSAEVVGFYEFSAYEDCVKKSGGSRAEAREHCLPEVETVSLGMYEGAEIKKVRLNRHCMRYGLVYARVAAASEPDKGKLEILHKPLPEEDCELVTLHEVRLGDFDLDGRRELVVDMVFGREAFGDQRSGNEVVDKATQRQLWVLEPAQELREQLVLLVGPRRVGSNADVKWVDLNADKRPDLVQVVDCDGRGGASGYDEHCDAPLRERLWYLYDRELDEWRSDAKAPQESGEAESKEAQP